MKKRPALPSSASSANSGSRATTDAYVSALVNSTAEGKSAEGRMKLRQPRWTGAPPGLRPGSAMPRVVNAAAAESTMAVEEQGPVAALADQEDAERRADGHGDVHADAEVAHRLAAAGERGEVRGERARRGAEGRPADAVQDAHGHQQRHGVGGLVEQ